MPLKAQGRNPEEGTSISARFWGRGKPVGGVRGRGRGPREGRGRGRGAEGRGVGLPALEAHSTSGLRAGDEDGVFPEFWMQSSAPVSPLLCPPPVPMRKMA